MKNKWTHFPFSPAKFPFFYGWVIVAVSSLSFLASIPGQTIGVGVFTDFLIDTLQINRIQISTAYMIGTVASSMLLPIAGRALDHLGLRLMSMLASVGLAMSLVLLSRSADISHFFGAGTFVSSMVTISIIFFLLRFFGQGCLTMTSRVAIGKWFDQRRGFAAAIVGFFVAVGFGSSPALLNWLVQEYTWQLAAILLAIAVGLGMGIIGGLFYRDKPEDVGLLMDGKTSSLIYVVPGTTEKKAAETTIEFTRGQALKNYSFWIFSFGMGTVSLIGTAVTFHIASIGAEQALSRADAYIVFLWIFPFSVAANLIGSWSSDRIPHKYLLIGMMTAQLICLVGLLWFDLTAGRIVFSIGQGVAGGLFGALSTVFLPQFYGRLHLGEISGINIAIIVFASAIGPILFSSFHSLTGSYQEVFVIVMLIPISLAIAGFWANNPQLKHR